MAHYWGFRTDRLSQALIFGEVQHGRLRQGWGYHDSQNLRQIKQVRDFGGQWQEKLSPGQREALPHYRMLGDGEDSIKIDDILLVPNLPSDQLFCLTRVTGEYDFQKLQLRLDEQAHGVAEDFGHVLPVELLTPNGVNKYAAPVHAEIRGTLKAQNRLWNLDGYGEHIERLLAAQRNGENLQEPQDAKARLQSAWESARSKAKRTLVDKLAEELARKFWAAEWEKPIADAIGGFSSLLAKEVVRTGGSREDGADLIIKLTSYLSDSVWQVVVQVKNYAGEIDDLTALDQIEEAVEHYGKDGTILEAIVMTTADRESKAFEEKRRNLQERLGVPVVVILRDRLFELMAEGLASDSPL